MNVRQCLEQRYKGKNDQKIYHLPKKAGAPMSTNYRPEIDISTELDAAGALYYQSLIGVLRWIVELGIVGICCEVSMLSSCLALPRQGHLQQLLHIFSYLEKHHNTELVFDPSNPYIDIQISFPSKTGQVQCMLLMVN